MGGPRWLTCFCRAGTALSPALGLALGPVHPGAAPVLGLVALSVIVSCLPIVPAGAVKSDPFPGDLVVVAAIFEAAAPTLGVAIVLVSSLRWSFIRVVSIFFTIVRLASDAFRSSWLIVCSMSKWRMLVPPHCSLA